MVGTQRQRDVLVRQLLISWGLGLLAFAPIGALVFGYVISGAGHPLYAMVIITLGGISAAVSAVLTVLTMFAMSCYAEKQIERVFRNPSGWAVSASLIIAVVVFGLAFIVVSIIFGAGRFKMYLVVGLAASGAFFVGGFHLVQSVIFGWRMDDALKADPSLREF